MRSVCNVVMQPEFRNVIPHRLLPIKAALVHQAQARGGGRLRDRAYQELDLQVVFDNAKAIGVDQRHLPFCTTAMAMPAIFHSSIVLAMRRSRSAMKATMDSLSAIDWDAVVEDLDEPERGQT
jgi:hypothetical protein